MSSVSRFRTKPNGLAPSGQWRREKMKPYYTAPHVFGPHTDPTHPSGYSSCADFVTVKGSFETPHDLHIKHRGVRPGTLDGTWYVTGDGSTDWWTRYVFEGSVNRRVGNYNDIGSTYIPLPSTAWALTRIFQNVAEKPIVDLPLLVWETKDFPKALRGLGDTLKFLDGRSKKPLVEVASGNYLEYTFGWGPLISDARSLINISDTINNRLRTLRNIRGSKRFHTTLFDMSDEVTETEAIYFTELFFKITTKRKSKMWATGRYKPISTSEIDRLIDLYSRSPLSSDKLRAHIFNHSNPAVTVWNAIPWSWMVDYYANVGDFIEAQGGYILTALSDVCIMKHQYVTETSKGDNLPDGLSYSGHKFHIEDKVREVPAYLAPSLAREPVMSLRQVANLGALNLVAFFRR